MGLGSSSWQRRAHGSQRRGPGPSPTPSGNASPQPTTGDHYSRADEQRGSSSKRHMKKNITTEPLLILGSSLPASGHFPSGPYPSVRNVFPQHFSPVEYPPVGNVVDPNTVFGAPRVSEMDRTSPDYDPRLEWERDPYCYKPVPSRLSGMYFCPACRDDKEPEHFTVCPGDGPMGVTCHGCSMARDGPHAEPGYRICFAWPEYHCSRLLPDRTYRPLSGRCVWCAAKQVPSFTSGQTLVKGRHATVSEWFKI